jgi:vitamin-K-epoxide reductase (warfarin-sensitive)
MKILRLLIVLLAIGGVVDSVKALRIHMQDPNAAPPCAVSEKWDCGVVNHSRYSVFPPESFDEAPGSKKVHVPVAAGGIVGYGLIAVLAMWAPWWMILPVVEVGFAGAAMLSYLEAFVMEKWCIYCVWSQSLLAALLLLSVIGWAVDRRRRKFEHSAVVVAE